MITKDPGYEEYCETHRWTPSIIAAIGTIFSFKLYRLYYSRWFGSTRFYIPLEDPFKIHTMFNIMTVLNIVFTIIPIIGVDIYGLYYYRWGG